KGGKSGAWVFDRAFECISEIRKAVGDDIPIIGMGGVSDGSQCAKLIQAGADAVGIGSALAHVGQKNWSEYFRSVRLEAQKILDNRDTEFRSRSMLSGGRTMEYKAFKVTDRKLHCEDTLLLTLDGKMASFKAGEFVFLWIPGVGEKPFSVAIPDPLTFIIKKRGVFTKAVFDTLKVGDTIMLRGPYGAEADTPKTGKAIILAGGTGEAVAFPLAQKLREQGTSMSFLVGTSVEGNNGILDKELSQFGKYLCVSDHGKPGRILDYLEDEIKEQTKDTSIEDIAFYLIGPEVFMKIASTKLLAAEADPNKVLLSMERNSMCGIGLCGECSCGGHLACQWGTFMRLDFLKKENVL
ncbi:MAG: alpha-hydroxy-acid oxidizing protein, partial [Spirochaetales bacterium]|nr:alpha-hydroxy-acid oxidizing protein [Spirochaetales bacterium]